MEGWARENGESWFALHVKPRHEKSVSRTLRAKRYTEFLPVFTDQSRWTDRYKDVERPLFPRYTFCHFDPRHTAPILGIPGVSSIVGFGKSPAAVEDDEILAIRAVVQSGLPTAPHPILEAGRRVRVCAGPLRGLTGILTRTRNADRLVVMVTLLQRSVAVEIDRDLVAPL